jgi:hypothetical protein
MSKHESELREYCAKENMAFKIPLLVNNAPGHPTTIQDLCKHIRVVFSPPNSSLTQVMDQGVNLTFKTYYLQKTFDTLVKAVNDKNMTVKAFQKSFTIRDAIMLVGEVCAAIKCSCTHRVWKKSVLIWCKIAEGSMMMRI